MSVKLMWSAMTIKAGTPTAKLILLKLADNANDKGECWPSLKNISEHCEVSQKTVIENIKKLEKLGLVKKVNRFNEKGKTSNLYILTLSGENDRPCEESSTTHMKNCNKGGEESSTTPCEESSYESVNLESINEPVKPKQSAAEQVVDLYNSILANKENQNHLPQVKVVTDKRRKVINKFLGLINRDLERASAYFRWILDNAASHRWIFGENDRRWVADIEYVCRDETFAKATEGRLNDWGAEK